MTSILVDRRDGLSSTAAVKGPCRAATTADITLAGERTIDGIAVVSGDRVLVKSQARSYENGLYTVDTGDWSRCKDFSRNDDVVKGTRVVVTDGTQASVFQVSFAGTLSLGTTEISFSNAPGFDLAGAPLATSGVSTLVGVDGSGNIVNSAIPYLTPEMFEVAGNRIGDGANDDAILTAWVNACNLLGIEGRGKRGATYTCSSTLALTFKVPFDGCGCEFVVPNNGQSNQVIGNDSIASDIENLNIATINSTWTSGLRRGSRKIPALANDANKDWQYTLITSDEVIMPRSDGSGGLSKGETFTVVDELGNLDFPLVRTYSLPFGLATTTCQRRRIREPQFFGNFRVRVVAGSGSDMNRVIAFSRPRTRPKNIIIFNESGATIQQGFVGFTVSDLAYEDCYTFGLKDTNTQYGFNANYSTRVSYTRCGGGGNRRDVDNHANKYVTVRDCVFPDGVGGHWIDYMDIYNTSLGHRNMNNPNLIHCSGSNIRAIDCHFHLGSGGTSSSFTPRCMNMRSDFPEWRGAAEIIGGTITIYDFNNEIETGHQVELMKFGQFDAFNYGRDIYQPDVVTLKPSTIELIGADSNNAINLVYYGAAQSAANMPNHVVTGGKITIEPGKIINEASELNGSTPRFQVILYRGETQKGNDTDVVVRNVKNPYIFCSPFTANLLSGHETEGRYNILVEDAQELAQYQLRYGACKSARLRRCKPASVFVRQGAAAALLDEAIDFEDFGTGHPGLLLNPFSAIIQRGNAISVADGAYGADGWIGLNESGNVTFAVAANVADGVPFIGQWQQPDASPKKIGALSFITSRESVALRSRLITMVAKIYASAAMTINYAIGEWTGTANSPTRDVVSNWASGSFTPGGFFINTTTNILATGSLSATTTLAEVSLPAHLGSGCNNLWVMFWTDAQIAQNAWFRAAADLFPGFYRPLLRRRSDTDERLRCSAFYQSKSVYTINGKQFIPAIPEFIKTPTASATVGTTPNVTVNGVVLSHTVDAVASTLVLAGDI